MAKALHELSPTTRFSDRAGAYALARPGYPSGAVDAVLEGVEAGACVIDLGAGTGIFSRLLAERGVRVVAVEPNAEMREKGAADGRLEWHDGTAERTGLGEASADVVVAAQSFHWFEATGAVREMARVLRPGGRLALVWNHRDPTDPVCAGYIDAIRAVGGGVDGEGGAKVAAEERLFDPRVVVAEGAFDSVERVVFANEHRLDREGLVQRALSASYCPDGVEAVEELRGMLGSLWEASSDRDGMVEMRYTTSIYRARRL